MKYIKRSAENVIRKQEKIFKAVLITGSRQVGKTTMLKNVKSDINYVTLDDMLLNQSANEDPSLFLKSKEPLLAIVPKLFSNSSLVIPIPLSEIVSILLSLLILTKILNSSFFTLTFLSVNDL